MITDANNNFKDDLDSLLKKYSVSLVAEDHYRGYPECGQDIKITAEFDNWEIPDIEFDSRIDPSKKDEAK